MSAYVIIEATVRDEASRARYSSKIDPILREYNGEVLAFGSWQMIFGEPAFTNGMIIRFPDKDTVLAWYNSPAYRALWELRGAALDCRFRFLG